MAKATKLHFVFRDFPGPGNECVFVEIETPDGKSLDVGEWRRRDDGLVELVVSQPDDQGLVQDAARWRWFRRAADYKDLWPDTLGVGLVWFETLNVCRSGPDDADAIADRAIANQEHP